MSIIKKYAVCVHNELRAVKTIKNNFYKNFIHQLNADLFIVARNNYKAETVNLFSENVVSVNLYDEIQQDTYINLHKLHNISNYLNFAHLQWYYNYYKIYETLGDILEKNYEYIILTRSDFLHMFEFPDILKLEGETENIFWTYEGMDWGGINPCLICVPSIYIKEYLKSFFEILQDEKNINELNSLDLNCERYTKFIFDKKGWKNGKIQPNAIITCDSMEEKTTWGHISYDQRTELFYKCPEFYSLTMINLQEYNQGKKWFITNEGECKKIVLTKF
jgi:hypothetical protein